MLLILSLFFFFSVCLSNPNTNTDLNALLSFKANTDLTNSLSSWINTTHPCTHNHSWFGVICNPTTHRVTGIVLQNLNLTGVTNPLSQVTELRLLSLKHNHLSFSSSSLLLNLSSWPNLKHLYLSHNRFSGDFPAGISHLRRLKRLDISHNNFSGDIPMAELTRLPGLLTLRLESNSFTGTLDSVISPSPSSASILDFDVSNNKLSGEIPGWMSRFPKTSFAGNENLRGEPLPHPYNSSSSNRTVEVAPVQSGVRGVGVVVLMTVTTIVLVMILATVVTLTCCLCKRRKSSSSGTHHKERKSGTHKETYYGSGVRGGGLDEEEEMVVFEGWSWKGLSNVGELLKCSAELLGKGSVGTTYKVVMDGGDAVVVKRVRDKRRRRKGGVDGLLGVIGALRHGNVVSLKAYYNSKDELLLVYDYLPNGSLHSLLHGLYDCISI